MGGWTLDVGRWKGEEAGRGGGGEMVQRGAQGSGIRTASGPLMAGMRSGSCDDA